MMWYIALGVTGFFYIGMHVYLHLRREQERDIILSYQRMAHIMKMGDSLEMAIDKVSHGQDKAAPIYQKIMEMRRQGIALGNAFDILAHNNPSLLYINRLVKMYESTGQSITDQLESISASMTRVRSVDEDLIAKVHTPMLILQFIAAMFGPLLILFVAMIIDTPVPDSAYFFMLANTVVFCFLDLIVYSSWLRTAIALPFFISLHMVTVQSLSAMVSNFFVGLF